MDRSKSENRGIRPGIILAITGVVIVLIAAKWLGWLGGSKAADTAAAPPSSPESPTSAAPGIPPRVVPPQRPNAIHPTVPVPPPGATTAGTIPVPATAQDWNSRLDDVLGGSEPEAAKADRLLAMWPGLPQDGQVEVMQHITNLLPDDKFPLLLNTFTNAQTQEDVLDVLMTDVLNRPNGLKLPVLLDVARTSGHPKAEEAREILEIFVDEDYGSDWPKWEKAIQEWIKANPDEEPEVLQPQ